MNFNFNKGKEYIIPNNENKSYHNNLLLFKDKFKSQSQISILSSRDSTKEKIDKIKMKYSLSQNSLNTQLVHRKIQFLKNKYMKDSPNLENKFKINNTIRYSINNNMNNKINLHSRNGINNNKSKIHYNFKYLKNIKEDFKNIHNKLKNLFQNDAFNKRKKNLVNMIFPISKKIYLLNEIKKDIKNVNKNSFNIISPKSTITTSSENTKNLFSELFSEDDTDTITFSKAGIRKPILIRTFTKPKLNIPKYTNLYNMKM